MEQKNAGKYMLRHDRESCIGCGACVAMGPENWSMGDDGKAKLIGAVEKNQVFEKNIDDFDKNKMIAEGCPVNVIHIFDKSGKKLI